MFFRLTEDNNFLETVSRLHVVTNLLCHHFSTLINDELTVKLLLFIAPVLKRLALDVKLSRLWHVTVSVNIKLVGDYFVWCEEAISYTLLKGVTVDRFAKILDV